MDERIEEILREHIKLSDCLLELKSPPATESIAYEALRDYLGAMKRLREIEQGPWPDAIERQTLNQHLGFAIDLVKSKCEEFAVTPLELAGYGLEMPGGREEDIEGDGGAGVVSPIITGPRNIPAKDAKPIPIVDNETQIR